MQRELLCDHASLMDASVAPLAFLPVADARRRRIARAVVLSIVAAGAMEVFALGVKEVRPLGDHAPWMDDPYDVVTSFAIFFIPILGAFSAVRLALCRRFEPLPVGRLVGLLHGLLILLAISLATAASDWISVVLGADRDSWTSVTPALFAALGLVTLTAVVAVGVVVAECRRSLGLTRSSPTHPDWLADATTLVDRMSRRLGRLEPVARRVIRTVDGRLWPWVRRRPVSAAAIAATGFAALLEVGPVREGYSPPIFAFVFVVAWCGMFALLVATGSYLGIVRSTVPLGGARRRLLDAALAGCISVPVALALRDSFWWMVGSSVEHAGLADLDRLLALVAASAVAVTLLLETLGHVHDGANTVP